MKIFWGEMFNFKWTVMFGCLLMAACEADSNLNAPREFFEKHKIGSSPDYAVIKWGDIEDHVATTHGFVDDLHACQLFVEALNKDACSETGNVNCLNPFSCAPLNH